MQFFLAHPVGGKHGKGVDGLHEKVFSDGV